MLLFSFRMFDIYCTEQVQDTHSSDCWRVFFWHKQTTLLFKKLHHLASKHSLEKGGGQGAGLGNLLIFLTLIHPHGAKI